MTNDEITWAAGSNPSARSDANSTPLPGARHAQALAPHPRSRVGRTSSRLGRACPVTPFTLNTGARASRPAADLDRGRAGESQSRARTTFYLAWPETSSALHGRDSEGGSGHVVPTCQTEPTRVGWAGKKRRSSSIVFPSCKFPRAASPAGAPVWPFLPARRRGNAGRARSLRVQVMTRGAGSEPAPFLQPM